MDNRAKEMKKAEVKLADICLKKEYLEGKEGEDLIKRIIAVSNVLQNTPQVEEGGAQPFNDEFPQVFLKFIENKNEEVQIYVACSLIDIFRITAPYTTPFKKSEERIVISFFISQLAKIKELESKLYGKRLYLLDRIASVGVFKKLSNDKEGDPEKIIIEAMTMFFQVLRHHKNECAPKVLEYIEDVLFGMFEGGDPVLADGVLDVLFEPLESRCGDNPVSEIVSNVLRRDNHRILKRRICSSEKEHQLQATIAIRQLLSLDNPPIDEICEANIVPILVKFLGQDYDSNINYEAVWALVNITGRKESRHTNLVIEENAVPELIKLLERSRSDNVEYVLWALANISGDSSKTRDHVLNCNVLKPLYRAMRKGSKTTRVKGTWCMQNICRTKQKEFALHYLDTIMRILCYFIHDCNDQVVINVLWCFNYVSDGSNYRIEACLHADVMGKIVDFLDHRKSKLVLPALRTVGNLVTGNDLQTEFVLACNVLQPLSRLLRHTDEHIRKEAIWTISNIAAGNVIQLQKLIDHNIINIVTKALTDSNPIIKKEAGWVIMNALNTGNVRQVHFIVKLGVVVPLVHLCKEKNEDVLVLLALDGLEGILRKVMLFANKFLMPDQIPRNPYLQVLEESGGVEAIKDLSENSNREISRKSLGIVKRYF